MSKRLEDIQACSVSVKGECVKVFLNLGDHYRKIEFGHRGILKVTNLTQDQYIAELQKNHPYLYGSKPKTL